MTPLTELPALNTTRFFSIRSVDETGSTNADLLGEAGDGAPEGHVLVTDHQTAGRGRQDRSWHDEPGNALLVSVLLRPRLAVAPLLPLIAGVAATEAVATFAEATDNFQGHLAGGQPVGLKWPNDVLAPAHGERKVAGILAESTTAGSGSPTTEGAANRDRIVVVVGMGMNLRWGSPPPPEIAARAATLTEVLGAPVARNDVLYRYLRAFEYWLDRLERSGPDIVLDRYRAHCLTIGRQVRFATGAGEHRGTAIGVSASGTLLLETADEVMELHAGDAHHLPLS